MRVRVYKTTLTKVVNGGRDRNVDEGERERGDKTPKFVTVLLLTSNGDSNKTDQVMGTLNVWSNRS